MGCPWASDDPVKQAATSLFPMLTRPSRPQPDPQSPCALRSSLPSPVLPPGHLTPWPSGPPAPPGPASVSRTLKTHTCGASSVLGGTCWESWFDKKEAVTS